MLPEIVTSAPMLAVWALLGYLLGSIPFGMVLTQALFSARGGETPPEKADETAADFKADVKKMMEEAREEIQRRERLRRGGETRQGGGQG